MTKTHLIMLTSFLVALSGMSINHSHLLLMLLCIESMILTVLISISLLAIDSLHTTPIPIIILSMAACESSIGLIILVISSNKNSNDLTKNMNLLQC